MIILAIVVLVFGASRLPKLGKGLGEGLRGFKDALKGDDGGKAQDLQKSDSDADDAA